MIKYKTIVDNKGNVIERCVLYIDNIPQCYYPKNTDIILDFCKKNFVKPIWDGSEWIEGATEKEIEEYNNLQ